MPKGRDGFFYNAVEEVALSRDVPFGFAIAASSKNLQCFEFPTDYANFSGMSMRNVFTVNTTFSSVLSHCFL